MRAEASILHLDLDSFFASVEQRDKPSLRGRPVIVGGLGGRGVVATASYEARTFGVHSAMSISEAHHRCPNGSYLAPRFEAYRQSSRIVMAVLKQLSPLVEPLSIDEAFVDLSSVGVGCTNVSSLEGLAAALRSQVSAETDGLTASVGIASSKFMAKIASEMAKPDGFKVVSPGSEMSLIENMSVRVIPGVGDVTASRLSRLAIRTVADLRQVSVQELTREVGQAAAKSLHQLAYAIDDRPVVAQREAKSISVEDTFHSDLLDEHELDRICDRDVAIIADKLGKQQLFAKTVSIKVRLSDFRTITRSRTLSGSTDSAQRITLIARQLLADVDTSAGVRLLGVGVSNFTAAAQEELFFLDDQTAPVVEDIEVFAEVPKRRIYEVWVGGMDVIHEDFGRGWVWGAGLGKVTVRFEYRGSGVGRVRTFDADDPKLSPAPILPLPGDRLVAADATEESGDPISETPRL